MARIVGRLPVAELEARYRAAREATEARHLQAIRLPARGRTFLEVAEAPATVPRRVEGLAARYDARGDARGPAAPGDRRRRNGRVASLPASDLLAALAERLQEPPEDGGPWGGPKVAARMARHLGLAKVHPRRGREALQRIGWSRQTPRPRHARAAAPGQQAGFKGGSTQRSPRPRRRVPAGRSRPGPRMNTASG